MVTATHVPPPSAGTVPANSTSPATGEHTSALAAARMSTPLWTPLGRETPNGTRITAVPTGADHGTAHAGGTETATNTHPSATTERNGHRMAHPPLSMACRGGAGVDERVFV